LPGHSSRHCHESFARASRVCAEIDAPSAARNDAIKRLVENDAEGAIRFRSIFISDIHLGTASCQAAHLLNFLRCTECDHLYLVGDIIDGWQLKRRWFWNQAHNDVVQKILRKARKGTTVTYVAGNHDEVVRHFLGLAFGGIEICEEAVHTTADGRRLLVMHGDLFDAVVQRARWLAHVGDGLYTLALKLNQWLNRARAHLGLPYWSLSQYLKHRVKNAVSYIADFERAVAAEARRRHMDGVVCGHIHKAEMRDIEGVLYCNDGDWVESLTALVEHADGRLQILEWQEIEALWASAVVTVESVGEEVAYAHSDRL
jgi:UDP-2,3-diacylglucosamine pyrophosphatase LpxH